MQFYYQVALSVASIMLIVVSLRLGKVSDALKWANSVLREANDTIRKESERASALSKTLDETIRNATKASSEYGMILAKREELISELNAGNGNLHNENVALIRHNNDLKNSIDRLVNEANNAQKSKRELIQTVRHIVFSHTDNVAKMKTLRNLIRI